MAVESETGSAVALFSVKVQPETVAEEFMEYLKELGFKATRSKKDVIVEFKYDINGKDMSNELYKKILESIKNEFDIFPY